VGIEWASRVTTIGLEFALPPLLGYGVDSWLRTTPVAMITGAVLGFATGMMATVKMARQFSDQARGKAGRCRDDRSPPPGPTGDANET
jgi:hypothetical protein